MPKKVSEKQKRARVLKYLKKNRLMTLGTSSGGKPWAATTFFAYDKNFNILFYSREDTRHCKHVRRNPNVSIVVNHAGLAKGKINGLQMTGSASRVTPRAHKRLYAAYKARFPWADTFASDHVLYVVKPKEVWYIDEKFFGHFYRVRVK